MDDEEKRQIANEVEDGRYEAWKEENILDLEKRFIKESEEDFEEFCRNDYKMFKGD